MLPTLCRRWLRRFSARYHYNTDYLEALLAADTAAFLKYASINLVSQHRRDIPPAPYHAAGIRAALWEDCGPCVQLVCDMALEAGIAVEQVAAIVSLDSAAMESDTALVVAFTEKVLARTPEADPLRAEIRQRWGEAALVSLAMTISATRVYPSFKYAFGYGHSCTRLQIGSAQLSPVNVQSARLATARLPSSTLSPSATATAMP